MAYVQQGDEVIRVERAADWPDWTSISPAMGKRLMRVKALAELRKILKPGDTVWTIVRHVSKSGMMRVIDVYVMAPELHVTPGGAQEYRMVPTSVAHHAACALDWPYTNDKVRGVKVSGCDMNMGFHLVDSLGRALGYTVPDKGLGDLKQRWL